MNNLFWILEYIIKTILLIFYSFSILKLIILRDYILKYEWINVFLIIGQNYCLNVWTFQSIFFHKEKGLWEIVSPSQNSYIPLPGRHTWLKPMLVRSHKLYVHVAINKLYLTGLCKGSSEDSKYLSIYLIYKALYM